MTKPDLMAELAALKETLETMAKFAPPPGTLCAPTMQMKLGWDAKSLLAKIDTHHAELEAAVRDARGEREESWEVWQDDMPVAGSDSLPDAQHYLAMYQQDGPVTLKRVVMYRETITPEQLIAMHNSAREG